MWNNSFLFKKFHSIVFLFKGSLLLIIPAFFLFLFSCKEPNTLGLEIQPPNDKPNVAICDTSKVDVYIVKEDSLQTNHLSSNLLGSYNDQIFGLTSASFYSQFRLPTASVDSFGTSPAIDSVVLTYKYSGYYGDTVTPLTFHVYELTENMNSDSNYYSNKTLTNDGNDLANLTMVPKVTDSLTVGGIKTSPHLRIKLNNSLGNKILNATPTQLSNNDEFLKFFKGLYIKTDPVAGNNAGTILYLSQVSSSFPSGIILYYHNSTADSLNYTIAVDYDCLNYNYFYHDYTNATDTLKSLQLSHSPKYVGALAYIQSMAGIKAKIIFPNIMEWAKIRNIAINQAELIISVEDNNTFTDKYAPSSQFALVGIDSAGKTYFLKDQTVSDNFFGGTYNATAKQYKFNISRHVQYLLQNKIKQFGMYLLTYGAGVTANRTVLKAGQNPSGKIKLSIIYTKL